MIVEINITVQDIVIILHTQISVMFEQSKKKKEVVIDIADVM